MRRAASEPLKLLVVVALVIGLPLQPSPASDGASVAVSQASGPVRDEEARVRCRPDVGWQPHAASQSLVHL
jgi:hypothetical protein